jgi:ell wall binding domain 2 (CWB2)
LSTLGPVRRLLLLLVVPLALAGCLGGGDDDGTDGGKPTADADAPTLGFPATATKNTTRVSAADPVQGAAAIARAVYPGTRPGAVVLADGGDWRAAIAASILAGSPLRAPILLTDGTDMPEPTRAALEALRPAGSADAGGAQVVRVGEVPRPSGLRAVDVVGPTPEETARAVDTFATNVAGSPARSVIVASSERPELAMSAAGWAARSGSPVLYATRDALPEVTQLAIRAHSRPRIYVLGGEDAIGAGVEQALARLGRVTRVAGADATATSIAAARLRDGVAGWGIDDPGHGLVFASARRPLDAVAAAPLSASGTYGPLLVLPSDGSVPEALRSYLLDIQPGYRENPVRGVYNHGWIVGDRTAVPLATQSAIDALLEISPVRTP